jgi:hypothetical protein
VSEDEFIDLIQQRNITAAALSRQEKHQLQLQWRAAYAFTLSLQSGRRTSNHRDWHIFRARQAVCRDRETALNLYTRLTATDFFIIPEAEDLPGLRCTSVALPDLSSLQLDLYISPPDFAWTMVFTHERKWHGPYFARRDWQKIKL